MKIDELFDKNPRRQIESIVKVNVHDPQIVRIELEEYVVTPQIKEYFMDLIDRFVESRLHTPPSVSTWISGFFGSGKSHFLKLLGYVLENKTIQTDDGSYRGAADYFCNKHSLSISHAKILEKELKTKAIFINMLDRDPDEPPSITRLIYQALSHNLGYSDYTWISEIERLMQDKGVWDDFLNFVEQKEGKPWQNVRKNLIITRSILSEGLCKLLPENFDSVELASKCIDDARNNFILTPTKLAERLLEEAEVLDKEQGRILILLDEVGLYVGDHTDRLNDLDIISESIESICKGKVWLYVTAQEALEEIIPKVETKIDQFEKIKDRFQIKVTLTPENIDTVVKKRLLQKTSDKTKIEVLEKTFDDHSGFLASAATIKNPARDSNRLFTQINKNEFIKSYPLLPYHVRLIQDILGILRSSGGVGPELTGRERALLVIVRSILITKFENNTMVNSGLGRLVTFDLVYDAINDELKAVKSPQQAIIENDIQKLGSYEGLDVGSVAKSLFLLQQVEDWLPCTLKNIAAVLYSDLGLDKTQHEKRVKDCLNKLLEGKWIAVDDDGKYKFLTEVERTFEEDVSKQRVNEHEKRELAMEIINDNIKKDLIDYNYEGKKFDVHLWVDEQEIKSKGHIKLKFYSPYLITNEEDINKTILSESIYNADTVYWLTKANPKFEDNLEKVVKLGKALAEKQRSSQSDEEHKSLEKFRNEMENLKDIELPRLLKKSAKEGSIIFKGDETSLAGDKKVKEIFNQNMKVLVENLFTLYSPAAFRLKKDELIGTILIWQGGTLPEIYKELGLVDEQENILTNRTVASYILSEVRKRSDEGLDNNGAELGSFFDSPPYGWDTRIVRLVLATLFRNGSIRVTLDGKDYYSVSEPGSKDAFINSKSFNRAIFSLGEEISPEQRNKARELIAKIFGESTGQTIEDVNDSLKEIIKTNLDDCERLKNTSSTLNLPTTSSLMSLYVALRQIEDAPTKSRRIITFLDKDINQEISENLNVLRNMINFEDRLDDYQNRRYFADNVVFQLNKINIISEKDVNSLKNDLSSADFYDRWPEIITKSEKLLKTYESKYSELHKKRNKNVLTALNSLKNHDALEILDENEINRIFFNLNQLKCSNEGLSEINEKPYRCLQCNSELSEINLHLETIETRKIEIKRKLDEIIRESSTAEPEYELEFKKSKEIKSVGELQEIIEMMQNVVEKAEKAGKKVKANIEIEEVK